MFAPSVYLDCHDYGPEYRLSMARVDNSIALVHEFLEDGYIEGFDSTDERDA